MIIVSAGMPKAGSSWYYNITNDLLVAAGQPDSREVQKKYQLEWLSGRNLAFKRLDSRRLKRLEEVSRDGVTFVVKTHRGPSASFVKHLSGGSFTATYIYRDLRDVIVSALEHGKYMRDNEKDRRFFGIGPYRSFGRLYTVEGATLWARWQQVPRWRAWTQLSGVLATRYEDLVNDTLGELKRLAAFLQLDVKEEALLAILNRYDRKRVKPRGRINFNKGVISRHREVLSASHQELCIRRLGPALQEMGYLPQVSKTACETLQQ